MGAHRYNSSDKILRWAFIYYVWLASYCDPTNVKEWIYFQISIGIEMETLDTGQIRPFFLNTYIQSVRVGENAYADNIL